MLRVLSWMVNDMDDGKTERVVARLDDSDLAWIEKMKKGNLSMKRPVSRFNAAEAASWFIGLCKEWDIPSPDLALLTMLIFRELEDV